VPLALERLEQAQLREHAAGEGEQALADAARTVVRTFDEDDTLDAALAQCERGRRPRGAGADD